MCVYFSLSQKGVDVNAELLNGRNPLHYAADYGHTDVLNYLISKGGKVDVSVVTSVYVCNEHIESL